MPRKAVALQLAHLANVALALTTLLPRPSRALLADTCAGIAAQVFQESSSTRPATFAPNGCDSAPVFTICDIRGDAGPCRDVPECSESSTVVDDGCDDPAAEANSCCTVSIWQPCTGCEPAASSCTQSCNFPVDPSSHPADPTDSPAPRPSSTLPPHSSATPPPAAMNPLETGPDDSPAPAADSQQVQAESGDRGIPADSIEPADDSAAAPVGRTGCTFQGAPQLAFAAAAAAVVAAAV